MTDPIPDHLREICLALPETTETEAWGHPNFRVAGKTFCVYEEYKGELSMCFQVGKRAQGLFLDDPRFYLTPYIGKHDSVSLKVRAARIRWKEVKDLANLSHGLVAPARLRKVKPFRALLH